jgi:hypothetical protein
MTIAPVADEATRLRSRLSSTAVPLRVISLSHDAQQQTWRRARTRARSYQQQQPAAARLLLLLRLLSATDGSGAGAPQHSSTAVV